MLLVTSCLLWIITATAQEPPTPPPAPPADETANEAEPAAEETQQTPSTTTAIHAKPAKVAPKTNPCEVRTPGREEWIDQFRREVFETVCEGAEWFDSFFGNRRFDEEARRTHGRVGARLVYDEHEGTEFDGKLKVRVDFPNLDHRVNAFLGREDEEQFLTGAENRLDYLPTFFRREGREEWLLGLGYRPLSRDRSTLDFEVGIDTPLDPFVSAKYRYYRLLSGESLMRARQTVYWNDERGVGSSSRLEFERPIGTKTLGRVGGDLVFDDTTDGADWDGGITIFHGFTKEKAMSFYVGVDGETGREVPIENYGTTVTYRQRMLRDWLFGEVITGVSWPRDTLSEEREMAWHFGFGFEIFFSGQDFRPRTRQ